MFLRVYGNNLNVGYKGSYDRFNELTGVVENFGKTVELYILVTLMICCKSYVTVTIVLSSRYQSYCNHQCNLTYI